MKQLKVDLHTHTTCSDGTDTPTQLVQKAFDENLDMIAITDHDTVNGLKEGYETAQKLGIKFVFPEIISLKMKK